MGQLAQDTQQNTNLAVVILNYGTWQDSIACAESVLTSSCAPRFVFIVDNASTNDSLAQIRRWGKEVLPSLAHTYTHGDWQGKALCLAEVSAGSKDSCPDSPIILVPNPVNKGYAAGNNVGINLAMQWDAQAVLILNNDTVVDKNAIAHMQEVLFAAERPGLCGATVLYYGTDLVQCMGGGKTNIWTGLSKLHGHKENKNIALHCARKDVEKNINFIYGACVMASRSFIENVGTMDERYFLYCEEQDWAYSSKGKFDLSYANNAFVWHKEGASTGFSSKKMNLRSLYYLTRSRILLTLKHHFYALPFVCLFIGFACIRMVSRRFFNAK